MLLESMFIAAQDTDTHRVCGCCGQLKPVEEFYRDGKYSDGRVRYRRDCKDCYKKSRFVEMNKKAKNGDER